MVASKSALGWITSGDTGISSETVWAVMMGGVSPNGRYDVPHDPSDFGRCHRLLELMPEWRKRLPEVADRFPKWGPMVREWDKMTALYLEELPIGNAPKLYRLMKELEDEGRIADGWVREGNSWRKPAPNRRA